MVNKSLRKQIGIVVLLDALGAASYPDAKIKKFLSARKKLNDILSKQAVTLSDLMRINSPSTYTFGDTLIVVIKFRSKQKIKAHILGSLMLMQNYLYHSLEEGILFRGAFSIGSYIEDSGSNTVMGEAVSDAASWYENSEWMGLASTPETNNVLEFYCEKTLINDPMFLSYYPVPMKDGREIDLYAVSWAGRFFHEMTDKKVSTPKRRFLELIKDHPVPIGSESKFENTKKFFSHIEAKITANKAMRPTAKGVG